jgi:hypothetical protein
MKPFATKLEESMIAALKEHKARTGVPTSITVRRAIEQYLAAQSAGGPIGQQK